MTIWQQVTIQDVCEAIYDGPHATPSKTTDGPVFLGISNLVSGRIDLSSTEHLSEADFVKWTRRVVPQKDDLVFSYETRLGEAALIPEDLRCCLGRRMALMRFDKSKVDPRFMLYAYLSPEFQQTIRERTVHGSTVDRIALTEFGSFPIRLPPLPIQREIAHILGSLDDKIDLNRRMNATLESIARALFKSWFVHFDPVRAKSEGRQPDGIDADTAALFPDSFDDSTLGPIPAGWHVAPLSEHIEAERGLSYNGDGLSDESAGLPMHNLNSIYEGGGYKYEGIKYYTGNYQERHVAKAGDLIIANTEQGHFRLLIGFPALIPKRYPTGLFSHHLYKVSSRSDSHITTRYLYFLFRTRRFHSLISGYSNGTTVNMLPPDSLERPKFVVPPAAIVTRFDEIMQPILDKLDVSYSETLQLTATRDALLPRLMSGELEV